MIDVLSLPRRHNINVVQIKNVKFKSGLPINSLPGWEHIPLNSKLPMLKCPGNQVIFTKNKIGQSFRFLKQEFDPYGHDKFPEYNPLHDSNLKTFYSNERNLKRLRQNGEITTNNDVICNLKDFNEYRQHLHKTQLYYILHELSRLEAEQHDRMLISNAEAITIRDHRNLSARQHTQREIMARKRKLDIQREHRFKRFLQKTQMRFQRIAGRQQMQRVLLEHRKTLGNIKMQQHWEVRKDLDRKKLINLKKLFQFKKERLKKNLRVLSEKRKVHFTPRELQMWHKRLKARIETQERMTNLLSQVAENKRIYIENHRAKYREKWDEIQEEIRMRTRILNSKYHKKKRRKPKKIVPTETKEKRQSFCSTIEDSIETLMDAEWCEALNAAIDMDENPRIPFNPDDPIYKAAHFIKKHIVAKFDKDLSNDKQAYKSVFERMEKFFEEAKKFVTFRATQIIANSRETLECGSLTMSGAGDMEPKRSPSISSTRRCTALIRRSWLSKCVSFSNISNTIGTSSYEIHPYMDVKQVVDRTPTPAGSLASIVVQSQETLVTKTQMGHLCRNELIYIEHFLIKFKRELIVGMGKRVFAAIRCHFDGNIMDVRKEFLDLSRNFLLNQVATAILSYAHNSLNFDSVLNFSISALSSEIIWSLQKQLLKPERDPRGIVLPKPCDCVNASGTKLCMFCMNCNKC